MGTVGLTTDQVRRAARTARTNGTAAEELVADFDTLATLSLDATTGRVLAGELVDELGLLGRLLDAKAAAMELADAGFSTGGAYLMSEVGRLSALLSASLTDDVGADTTDARIGVIERGVFGLDGRPEAPTGVDDVALWEGEHVTAAVLDDLDAETAAEYWALIGDDARFAVIQAVPGAVSDRVLDGDVVLVGAERFALLVQPVDPGRPPQSGSGTDYLGQVIPTVQLPDGDDDGTVRLLEGDVDDGIDFFPDNPACTLIQAGSLIPSRPDPSVVGAGAAAYNVYSTVDTGYTIVKTTTAPLKAISPASWAATLADVTFCRLEFGSGDPISIERVLDDDGDMVYEDSRSESQPYMDPNGLPVAPTLEGRDLQRWRNEHQGAEWEPYPGYPAYPEYAPGN